LSELPQPLVQISELCEQILETDQFICNASEHWAVIRDQISAFGVKADDIAIERPMSAIGTKRTFLSHLARADELLG
jgi:hypothetical protein